MTVLMDPEEGETTVPVVIDCRPALGGLSATSGQVHNLGPVPFRYQITLNGQTCDPITVMDGTKWTVPCYFDAITILPVVDGPAVYSVDAEAMEAA